MTRNFLLPYYEIPSCCLAYARPLRQTVLADRWSFSGRSFDRGGLCRLSGALNPCKLALFGPLNVNRGRR